MRRRTLAVTVVSRKIDLVGVKDVVIDLVPKLGWKAQKGRVALVGRGAFVLCQFENDILQSQVLTGCRDPFSPDVFVFVDGQTSREFNFVVNWSEEGIESVKNIQVVVMRNGRASARG
jgi:hypothetical protein